METEKLSQNNRGRVVESEKWSQSNGERVSGVIVVLAG